MTLLLHVDPSTAPPLLSALGAGARHVASLPELRSTLQADETVELVVVGPDVDLDLALDLAMTQRLTRPGLGVVLVRSRIDSGLLTQALRAGIRDVVKADNLTVLAEACDRSRDLTRQVSGRTPDLQDGSRTGQLVTVFAAKGGCGKTTMATNLAATLADGGRRRVCLVDLDLSFGDVAIAMQLTPARTLADASHLVGTLDQAAARSLVTQHSPGLDVVAAPMEPGAAESLPVRVVSDLLDVLKGMYDIVVVDSPPAFTDHVLAAFDRSEHFVLLATLDVPALKNLKLTLETLGMLGYAKDTWHVALNRSDAKVGLTVTDVQKALGHPIAVQIPSSRAVPASINRGVLIALDQPTHSVSTALRRFATTFHDGPPEVRAGRAHATGRDKRGLGLRRRASMPS